MIENYRDLSKSLVAEGFTVNCVPLVDVPVPGAHDIIGDRAYGENPEIVTKCALDCIEATQSEGVTPVIKHLPGHGRAGSDSHEDLPVVETDLETLMQTDFKAFKDVCARPVTKDCWGMTAHVIYSVVDPDYPATLSKKVIDEIIRGYINFDGLLLGDDLFMKALDKYGDMQERIKLSEAAGIDVHLHCHGTVEDMEKAAQCSLGSLAN